MMMIMMTMIHQYLRFLSNVLHVTFEVQSTTEQRCKTLFELNPFSPTLFTVCGKNESTKAFSAILV